MNIKKTIFSVGFGLMSLFTASAQDLMPEAMPARCTAEKIVTEVAAVTLESEAEAARTVRTTTARNRFGENIVKTALQYLGARYRSGMSGPYAFDCSGFTSYVYGRENVSITRSSRSQYTQGMPVRNVADLQKGDLAFFGGSRSHSSVGHVGIVTDVDPSTGKFSFVHASRTGVKVSEAPDVDESQTYSILQPPLYRCPSHCGVIIFALAIRPSLCVHSSPRFSLPLHLPRWHKRGRSASIPSPSRVTL